MILTQELAKQVFEIVLENKGIGRTALTEDMMIKYFNTINKINSLSHTRKTIGEDFLSEYLIFTEWKDLIYPKRVTFTDTESEKDLVARLQFDLSKEILTAAKFNTVTNLLYGCCRKSGTKGSDINTIRTNQTIAKCITKGIVDGKVVSENTYFNPLELTVTMYDDDMYCINAVNWFKKWITQQFTNVQSNK